MWHIQLICYSASIEKPIAKLKETSPKFAKFHSFHNNKIFYTVVNMNNLSCQNTVYIPDISISGHVNPFVLSASFLYPLITSENLTFFWCFQRVEKGCIGNKWVKRLSKSKFHIQILYVYKYKRRACPLSELS